MITKLTIRKNGKYYQVGYYDNGRWVNVAHLGSPEQLLLNHKLICALQNQNTNGWDILTLIKDLKAKILTEIHPTHQIP